MQMAVLGTQLLLRGFTGILGKRFVKGLPEGSNSQAGGEILLKYHAISRPALTYHTIERCVTTRMNLVHVLAFCGAHDIKGMPIDHPDPCAALAISADLGKTQLGNNPPESDSRELTHYW